VTGDGGVDILVTNFSEDFSTLYRGVGDGFFEDATDQVGVGGPSFLPLSWGAVFADLDNDGDQDIVIANGHIYPQVDGHPKYGHRYEQVNLLLENTGGGHFVDVTRRAGPGFGLEHSSRGLAAGDYDNDGDLDLLITNLDGPPTLLRNDSEGGFWLTVICEVSPGLGTLIGTTVTAMVGGRKLVRDVSSSDSYLSAHDPRVHFGLGDADVVDRLEIRWADGQRTLLEDVPANQFLTVRKQP
jgi:hypothetical protein